MVPELVNVFEDNWKFKEVWREGDKIEVKIREFINYFYCLEEDLDRVIELANEQNREIDISDDMIYDTIDNKKVRKISMSFYYPTFTRYLKEVGLILYESDLSNYVKYMSINKLQFAKNRRVFFLDIETDMGNMPQNPEQAITSICIYDNLTKKYYLFAYNEKKDIVIREDVILNIFDTEKEMLKAFIEFVSENHPDIIGTWYGVDFDIPYIINRCKLLKIDVEIISLADSKTKIRCEQRFGSDGWKINIPGIDVLDMIPILQRITAYQRAPPNNSLMTVSNFFLGEKYSKLEFNPKNWQKDFEGFLKYNMRDVEILKELDEKMGILNYAITLQSEITPIILEACTFNSYILEMFLKCKYPDLILLDKKQTMKLGDNIIDMQNMQVKIKGAFTGRLEEYGPGEIDFVAPEAGLYKNVEVFDFAGMYASIYSTFNICCSTLEESGDFCVDNIEFDINQRGVNGKYELIKSDAIKSYFNLNRRGFIPQIIDEVRAERKKYKKILKEIDKKKNPLEFQKNKCVEDVLKLIGNAFYGVMSYNNFRLFNPHINGAITKLARDSIVFINRELKKLGYITMYSDTDSVFIRKEDSAPIDTEVLTNLINQKLKEHVLAINPKLENNFCMNLEHAYSFEWLVFTGAKKRYYGMKKDGEVKITGVEIIRRDTPKKAKPLLQEIFFMLPYKSREEVKKRLIEIKKEIRNWNIYDIGINLTLTNDPEDYETKIQHARGAEYTNKYLNGEFTKADKLKLVFIKATGKYPYTDLISITDDIEIPADFVIDYDRFFEFMFIKKLKQLEDVKEFDINFITTLHKTLNDFFA